MEELAYLEEAGRRNAAFSLDTLDKLNQRANALLTLLLGGAGGAGAYALGQIDKAAGLWVVAPLVALSLWWFVLAAWVAMRAVPTREVRAPAGSGYALLQYLQGPLAQYVKTEIAAGREPKDAFTLLREAELSTVHETAAIYRQASDGIATVLDRVYIGAAASPVFALAGLLAVWMFA